jgi:hypothetical protein
MPYLCTNYKINILVDVLPPTVLHAANFPDAVNNVTQLLDLTAWLLFGKKYLILMF